MRVVPMPDHWMEYKPLPEMKGKVLGIFAHMHVKDAQQDAIKHIYRTIVDVAIEEKTCVVLSGAQSLVDPTHNVLYEEWTDYEEFFTVQGGRTYRNGYKRWLDRVRDGMVLPEFTEMFHSSGKHPYNVAYKAYTLVQSVHIAPGREDEAKKLFIDHVDDVGRDSNNLVANIHQSINNPQHFLLYEIWSDFGHLVEKELRSDRRSALEAGFTSLKDDDLPEPALELFQIYYDPDKYDVPAEWG